MPLTLPPTKTWVQHQDARPDRATGVKGPQLSGSATHPLCLVYLAICKFGAPEGLTLSRGNHA